MYKATNRVVMIFGAERELVLPLMVVCFALVFAGLSWLTTMVGIGGWLLGTFLLREIGKKDKMMSKIFVRYWTRHQQPVFPATAPPGSRGHWARR